MFKDDNQLDDFFGLKSNSEKRKIKKEGFGEIVLKNIKSTKLKFIPKVLTKRERYLILIFSLIILGSFMAMPLTIFYHFTKESPDFGGSFIEGEISEPRHINPLLSQTNDADRGLVSLIYSELLKYNEQGKLVPDLAKSYEISSDGLNYTIYLKENVKWHDGASLTADDVLFTVETAQNADYGSLQRINWQGIEITKANDYTIIFKLKNNYAQFLNNLTLYIMPKHIWQNVRAINFSLSDFNLRPIGSGPYKFKKLKKDKAGRIKSYELEANKYFYDHRPYIGKVELKYYDSEDEMIDAYNKNSIQNISFISPQNLKKVKFKKRLNIRNLKLPRYFAVFFNQNQSKILVDKNIRQALSYGTDKLDLIKKILDNYGTTVDSPMIGELLDINNNIKKYNYNPDEAKRILNTAGWSNPDEKGILRKKIEKSSKSKGGQLEDRLSLKITTSTWPELNQVANMLKEQWSKIGVEVSIEVLPNPELQQVIKERNYQILLFGEILNLDPDPFSLWHSSQKRDPGLNLALYDNKTADTLLEDTRKSLNPLERLKKYDDFQKIVIEDIPAIFLYNSSYLYGQTKSIKGFETQIISTPSDRFANIGKWFIKTKRSWK